MMRETRCAHTAAEGAFRAGQSGYASTWRTWVRCTKPSELPYSSIIALNQHGAVLHYGPEPSPPAAPQF
jgi:Xaa-Pro dipeptidase